MEATIVESCRVTGLQSSRATTRLDRLGKVSVGRCRAGKLEGAGSLPGHGGPTIEENARLFARLIISHEYVPTIDKLCVFEKLCPTSACISYILKLRSTLEP